MSTKRKPVVTIYEDELPDLYKKIVQRLETLAVEKHNLEQEVEELKLQLNTKQRILLN